MNNNNSVSKKNGNNMKNNGNVNRTENFFTPVKNNTTKSKSGLTNTILIVILII